MQPQPNALEQQSPSVHLALLQLLPSSEQRLPRAATNNHRHDCTHTSPIQSLALLPCFVIWYIKNSTDSKCTRPEEDPAEALAPWVYGTALGGVQSERWGVCGACSSEWEK